jgi:hypothetical protein
MKNFLLQFLWLVLLVPQSVKGQAAVPVIAFETKEHDFGSIKESNGPVSYSFNFTNSGKAPLILNNVAASCGCTTPEWTKQPVLPGKQGVIKVTFDPEQRPGAFTKTITVTSNAETPSITLAIRGVVIPVSRVEEVYHFSLGQIRLQTIYASFGEIYKGNTGEAVIKVMNTSADQAATLTFRILPPYLNARMDPETLEPGKEGNIIIQYKTDLQKDWDYVVERLELLVNGQSLPNNRISVTANIRENFSGYTAEQMENAPKVEYDAVTYEFGTVPAGTLVEHSYTLTNTGKSDLYIRKVSASCGCTAVQPATTKVAPGASTLIKAAFNTAGREGNQKKAITVITNDPKRSKTVLWINGVVSAAAKTP